MLWWLVDNANLVFLVLGLIVLVLAVRWRLTRRGKYLIGAGVVVALIGVVWALTLLIVTDRKRLVQIVEEVTEKLNRKDFQGAFTHMADEVQLEMSGRSARLPRKALQGLAESSFKRYGVPGITVWSTEVEKVERPTAQVSFYLRPTNEVKYAVCTADFLLVGEDWLVSGLKIEPPAGAQIPFP